MEGKCRIFYYKNQKQEEVDFVIQQGLKITQLIQVCYSLSEPKVKEREIRGLLKASTELECRNLIIITNDLEVIENHTWFGNAGVIQFIPLWKWFFTDVGS
jgi:predicted AAA+ superfamily ATPase